MTVLDLTKLAQPAFYRRGTKCALPSESGEMSWRWATLMDTGVDIVYSFDKPVFVGCAEITLAPRSAISSAEVFCDGRPSGRYDAETGKTASGRLEITVGASARCLILRLNACLLDISVEKLQIIGAEGCAASGSPLFDGLFPAPKSVLFGEGRLLLGEIGGIAHADNRDLKYAADHLRRRVSEYYGSGCFNGGGIPFAMSLCDDGMSPDGYRMSVKNNGISLCASSRRGLLYGCETFFSLISGETPGVRLCEISDEPYKEMRGFHMMLPPREQLDFARRVFRYVLLPLRYNMIFIEFAGGMRFDRHPEISEGWLEGNRAAAEGRQPPFPHGSVAGGGLLEKSEVRALVEYAKELGFEVIPEVQSFGHVQYITYSHPEIAELSEERQNELKDTRTADQPPDVFYHHSYCPLNEDSYKIIFDIIDEILEVVRPERYVHMGHDEVYQIGLCPRCRDRDHAELYTIHVKRMYDYLKAKGLKMAIWSDMLQPTEKRYRTNPARDMLPRDILMLDFIWYFHFDLDMEDHLLPYGYNVIMGNLYSSHYPRYESRAAKEGMLGGQVSCWCVFSEYTLAKKGKFFDLIYTAEMLWNPDYNSLARPVYNEIIGKELIPRVRDELRGCIVDAAHTLVCSPLSPCKTETSRGCIPCELKAAAADCDDPRFDTSHPIVVDGDIAIAAGGQKFERLVFLHAATMGEARVAWKPLKRIGSYTVCYGGGAAEDIEIPVEYAGNITAWPRRYGEPMPQQYYRHQGYTATYFSDPVIETYTHDGRPVTVLGYVWMNPHPDKPIERIVCRGSDDTGAKIALLAVSGVNIAGK